MPLPENLEGFQDSADNRAWHRELRARLPHLNLPEVTAGRAGHLAHHEILNAWVNSQTGASLPVGLEDGNLGHELHHNVIHAHVNSLDDDGGDGGLTFGFPVYTQEEIDAWPGSGPDYNRANTGFIANTGWGGYTGDYGTHAGNLVPINADASWAKAQAVLWAADGRSDRLDAVTGMLDALSVVQTFAEDGQDRLLWGWAATNICQAAAIVGYESSGLEALLRYGYPLLDWRTGGNWHASFADSRLAIAAYLGDEDLWEEGKEYFDLRIRQSIFYRSYDGDTVEPCTSWWPSRNLASPSATEQHWWGQVNGPAFVAEYQGVPFPDGTNAERTRDLDHPLMGMSAWVHCARTILAQGDTLEQHVIDRLAAFASGHGDRILQYMEHGTVPDPQPNSIGSAGIAAAWFGVQALLGDLTPAVVNTLVARSEVIGWHPGANHTVIEHFADKKRG